MEVTIKIPDKLVAEARARGVPVEVYVQEILARQTLDAAGEQRLQSEAHSVPDFAPMPIRGENLSSTVLRDRR
jgi:hypothetical protein